MARHAAFSDADLAVPQLRRPRQRASAGAWFFRVLTGCLVVAAAMVVGDFAANWFRVNGELDGRATDPTPIAVFVGEQRLLVPGNMFRFENQRNVGPHEHVDLAVHWPTLQGYSAAYRADFLDGSPAAPIMFITIRRRQTATDSAGRLVNVYQHYFEPGALPAPPGLVGRRLSGGTGLAGEEVYFEAGSTMPFTVHCLAEDGSGFPTSCLTELHAGDDLSVQVRFRRGLLPQWAGMKSALRALLFSYGLTTR